MKLGQGLARAKGSNSTEREELTAIAYLAITKAVDRLTPDVTNATERIVVTIKREFAQHKAKRQIIYVPRGTNSWRKCNDLEQHAVPDIVDIDYHNPIRLDAGLENVELDDLLDVLCQTDTERQVVTFRLQGYTDKEVGIKLGISPWAVWSIRQELQSRYTKNVVDRS